MLSPGASFEAIADVFTQLRKKGLSKKEKWEAIGDLLMIVGMFIACGLALTMMILVS